MTDIKVKEIAKKWYEKLSFPKETDNDFYHLLETESGFSEMPFSEFDLTKNDPNFRKNVIWALYFCEELSTRFSSMNISEKIMLDTMNSIKLNMMKGFDVTGELAVRSFAAWLHLYYEFKLFNIGRLQYETRGAFADSPTGDLKKGAPVLAVHIPVGDKLTEEACLASFSMANDFFSKYFPNYNYEYFTCLSWLLDRNLNYILPKNSNIIKFGELFEPICDIKQDDAIEFTFPLGTTRENIKNAEAKSSLHRNLKEYVLSGGELNITFGIRDKHK